MNKIANLPEEKQCRDKQHLPPTMISLPDGVYKHICPTCSHRTVTTIRNPKMQNYLHNGEYLSAERTANEHSGSNAYKEDSI